MISLPRLWLRQGFKLLLAVGVLSAMVLFVDVYFNFLPTAVHTNLPLHHPSAVIVDVAVDTCMTVTGCTSAEGWTQVPKNVFLDTKWVKKGYVSYKWIHDNELDEDHKVVLDVAIGSGTELPAHVRTEVGKSLHIDSSSVDLQTASEQGWTSKGGQSGLWVRFGKFHRSETVTAIDVLFGPDAVDPRRGWHLRQGGLFGDTDSIYPRVTIRKGAPQDGTAAVDGQVSAQISKPTLKVGKTGRFKVLQIADLHLSTGEGVCRDPFPADDAGNCKADPRTIDFVSQVLDSEEPDFVVLTGDQVFGSTAPDSMTALLKAVAPMIDRQIPYAAVNGNHDAEGSLSKEDLISVLANLPFSLTEMGPDDVNGAGNYVLQVEAPQSNNPAITMYFLDSHTKVPTAKGGPGFEHIQESQLQFVQHEHSRLKPAIDRYTHIPLAMAFFHIPLPEYRKAQIEPVVGSYREAVMGPETNIGTRDVLAKVGVSVVSVGHDHVNDYCLYDTKEDDETKLWLCYGGGVGEGGYGGYGGYIRRMRVYEIDTQSATIKSWKLTRDDPELRVDEQVLVTGGVAHSPDF